MDSDPETESAAFPHTEGTSPRGSYNYLGGTKDPTVVLATCVQSCPKTSSLVEELEIQNFLHVDTTAEVEEGGTSVWGYRQAGWADTPGNWSLGACLTVVGSCFLQQYREDLHSG